LRHELGTLHDIVDSARLAREYVEGLSLEQFQRDSLRQDAVCRRLLVIGEAVRRRPESVRERYPSLPWGRIVGLRNVLVHQYDEVDWSTVWVILGRDLPELIAELGPTVDQALQE
jgi:uncharacterized protein with HEPN domain